MIKISYKDSQTELPAGKYQEKLEKIKNTAAPDFESTKTDLHYIAENAKPYQKYKNVILIGNGGSRTSAYAFYQSLADFRNKVNFEFLTSAEPFLIRNLRKKYSPQDTLVLAVSKSGDNINALEPLLAFSDYPVLVITGEKENPLFNIARQKRWDIIFHPEVGGRFSGLTSCGLVPAYLMGLPIEKIYEGASLGYKQYNNQIGIGSNDALKLAAYFFALEEKGFTEIFASVYSTPLSGFLPLLIQLVHESAGKDGKGQTIFGDYSPESQHHTNQRLFGGRKNIATLFIAEEKPEKDLELEVPDSLKDTPLKNKTLAILNGISGNRAMHYDKEGVIQNCRAKKIPALQILIDTITPKAIGEFMVFWQYFSVYSALLRDANPYDQPEVEESKRISFELRARRN